MKRPCFYLLASATILAGCNPGNPVPAESVRACLEKGGTPLYFSNSNYTKFECAHGDAQ